MRNSFLYFPASDFNIKALKKKVAQGAAFWLPHAKMGYPPRPPPVFSSKVVFIIDRIRPIHYIYTKKDVKPAGDRN